MSKEERVFPLEYKHKNGILVARNETQASAFEKAGFKPVKSKKKDEEE